MKLRDSRSLGWDFWRSEGKTMMERRSLGRVTMDLTYMFSLWFCKSHGTGGSKGRILLMLGAYVRIVFRLKY